jgi:hypothetical protein
MSDLGFMLPPTVQIDGQYFEVIVHPTPVKGDDEFVHVIIYPTTAGGKRKHVSGALFENLHVPRGEATIMAAVVILADAAAKDGARRMKRRKLLRPHA